MGNGSAGGLSGGVGQSSGSRSAALGQGIAGRFWRYHGRRLYDAKQKGHEPVQFVTFGPLFIKWAKGDLNPHVPKDTGT